MGGWYDGESWREVWRGGGVQKRGEIIEGEEVENRGLANREKL